VILVGLTGSIATGKSTVARMLKRLGAILIDGDELARRAVAPGSDGLKRVVERFGAGVLTAAGELDRAAMRRIIFADPGARAELEAIIHPLVLAEEERLIQAAGRADPRAVVVVDLPLLYEIKAEGRYDKVIVVYVDRRTQLDRVMARDGGDRAAAEQALAAQMDIETKRARADFVVDNRGGLAETEAQVARLYRRLEASA